MEFLADPPRLIAVLAAGLLAGAGNTIAGGGTTLSFPILVWVGLPPQIANATNTLGLLAGSAGGAWSYQARIRGQTGWQALWVPALVGGGVGAALLLLLPAQWFSVVAPWMVLGSAVLVAADPLLRRRVAGSSAAGRRLGASMGVMFLVAVYGGYFGSGIGILVLFTLGMLGIADLHDANGLKNLLVVGIKGVAGLAFIVTGMIDWPVAAILLAGSVVGGWGGGHLIQKVDQTALRWIVVAIGVAMGIIMLLAR